MIMLTESQKNELYKSILADVAKIVKHRIEEFREISRETCDVFSVAYESAKLF